MIPYEPDILPPITDAGHGQLKTILHVYIKMHTNKQMFLFLQLILSQMQKADKCRLKTKKEVCVNAKILTL